MFSTQKHNTSEYEICSCHVWLLGGAVINYFFLFWCSQLSVCHRQFKSECKLSWNCRLMRQWNLCLFAPATHICVCIYLIYIKLTSYQCRLAQITYSKTPANNLNVRLADLTLYFLYFCLLYLPNQLLNLLQWPIYLPHKYIKSYICFIL